MRDKVRVMIVEDQEMIRDHIMNLLEESSVYDIAASLGNADLADIYCEKGGIDLILMDVYTMHGASGLDASFRIKKKYPGIKIIIITSMPEFSYLERARNAGVDSFWYKENGRENLIDIMTRTMEGESIYPERTPEVILGNTSSYKLTDRELEVLKELTSGDTNEEIAQRLYMSKFTVKDHIKNMLEKTGFRSRTELKFVPYLVFSIFDRLSFAASKSFVIF